MKQTLFPTSTRLQTIECKILTFIFCNVETQLTKNTSGILFFSIYTRVKRCIGKEGHLTSVSWNYFLRIWPIVIDFTRKAIKNHICFSSLPSETWLQQKVWNFRHLHPLPIKYGCMPDSLSLYIQNPNNQCQIEPTCLAKLSTFISLSWSRQKWVNK